MKKLLIAVPLLAIAVVALALAGKLNIPGLTPKKAAKNAANMYGESKDKLAPKPHLANKAAPIPEPHVRKPSPTIALSKVDPAEGASALAKVWNEIPVPALAKITKPWKDADLALVLQQMDTTQVAKLITAIAEDQPARASSLSKSIQKQNSVVEIAPES